MSSLEATKADGYYYGPEFDPKRHKSLNKYRGVRPPMDKRKGGLQLIRFEMPFKCWCNRCSRVIAKGVRFNATKTCTGMYFSTKILQFSFFCPGCNNPLAIGTDPKHAEYTCVEGLRRKVEPLEYFLEKQQGENGSALDKQAKSSEKNNDGAVHRIDVCSSEHQEEQKEEEEKEDDATVTGMNGAATSFIEAKRKKRRRSVSMCNESSSETHTGGLITHGISNRSSDSNSATVESPFDTHMHAQGRETRGSTMTTSFAYPVSVMSRDISGEASTVGIRGNRGVSSVGEEVASEEDDDDDDHVLILPGVEERELMRLDPMQKLAYLSSLKRHPHRQQILQESSYPFAKSGVGVPSAPLPGARTAAAAATAARAAAAAIQQEQEEEEAAFEAMLAVSHARHRDPYSASKLLRQRFLAASGRSDSSSHSSSNGSSNSVGHTGSHGATEAARKGFTQNVFGASSSQATAEIRVSARHSDTASSGFSVSGRKNSSHEVGSHGGITGTVTAVRNQRFDHAQRVAEEEAAADVLIARNIGFRQEKTLLQQYVERTRRYKTNSIFNQKPPGNHLHVRLKK